MVRNTPRTLSKISPGKPRRKAHKIALVLGGGGLKGFAHIGVFRALQEMGIEPTVVAGTSIGALIAAAYCRGMDVSEMADRARALKRRDLFRLNRMGFLLERQQERERIDAFKLQALDSMQKTIDALTGEVAKAQSYLERAHGAPAAEALASGSARDELALSSRSG